MYKKTTITIKTTKNITLKLFCLLSFIQYTHIHANKSEQYEGYLYTIQEKSDIADNEQKEALEILLENSEGEPYAMIYRQWLQCSDKFYYDTTRCTVIKQKTKDALKILQETDRYKNLMPLFLDTAYYEYLIDGLEKIIIADLQYENASAQERIKNFHDIINMHFKTIKINPSSLHLYRSYDSSKTLQQAQQELIRIVDEVESEN